MLRRDVLFRLREARSGEPGQSVEHQQVLDDAIDEIEMLRALVDQQTVAEIEAELRHLRHRRSPVAVAVAMRREGAGVVASWLRPGAGRS